MSVDATKEELRSLLPVRLIRGTRWRDERGWFMETFHRDRYRAQGIDVEFVQDNHAMSREAGVLRGLHWQAPPFGQDKLVRCVRGAVWDVAVDIRRGSPTFGDWVAAELSAENGYQLFVSAGFAHGYLTLQPDTEIEYKVSQPYTPQAEAGLAWNDPGLALPWPLNGRAPILSARDQGWPCLGALAIPFGYDGRPLRPIDA